MQIDPKLVSALQSLRLPTQTLTPENKDLLLQLGQEVLAKVVSMQGQNLATLLINNTLVQARSQLPLQIGQLLQLVVAKTGDEIELRPTEQEIRHNVLQQQLRETLPREKSLQESFTHLAQALQKSAQAVKLPAHITQLIKQVLQKLPSREDVKTPEGLKTAMKNSGVFSERALAETMANPKSPKSSGEVLQNDIKLMLSQLKTELQQVRDQITQAAPPRNTAAASATTETPTTLADESQPATDTPERTTLATPVATKTAANVSKTDEKVPAANDAAKTAATTTTTSTATPASTQKNPSPILGITRPPSPAVELVTTLAPEELSTNPTAKTAAQQANAVAQKPSATQGVEPKFTPATDMRHAQTSSVKNILDTLTDLIKTVDSAISRTQLHQLQNLNESEQGRFAWTFELPLRNGDKLDLLKMRIERDAEHGKARQTDAPLTVTLGVDLENIGPIQAKLVLVKSNVNVTFWAERPTTYRLVVDNLDELKNRLHKSGLKTENVACIQGQSPTRLDPDMPPAGLVDVTA